MLDERVRRLLDSAGLITNPLPGTGPAPYLGSEASTPNRSSTSRSAAGFPNAAAGWFTAVQPFLGPAGPAAPVLQISSAAHATQLPAFLARFAGAPVGISVRTGDVAPPDLAQAISGIPAISFIHPKANARAYLRTLPAAQAIEVEHAFNVQPRNADYHGQEFFTGSHRGYASENRTGYSDFGPLSPTFKVGGGQASAVAVHLTFLAEDGDIWVEHFVSDSVERGDGNATSKLREAVTKVAARVAATPSKFVRSDGLSMFFAQHQSGNMTSLGQSKRQQIMHHLHTAGMARTTPQATPTP
ncbi:MAG: sce7725 family protein [Cellulomonadaceae bacterium]|nr:sce7725 family protein [Cellulomonadaceae bacterium]